MDTITLRDVKKVFEVGENRIRALAGVNLKVGKGEFLAIMGASGSGKSTLLNILGCLDSPTSGEYVLDGQRVSDLNGSELAYIRNRKIGFVFQGFNLLPRTAALENVELPLLYDRSRRTADPKAEAAAALDRVGLGDRTDHVPNQLSGGQQQRVAIARALVTRPAILLADEPTGNLDSRTTLEIMELFQSLNSEGITIVMVTHEPDVAAYAQRVVEMKDGVVTRDHQIMGRSSAAKDLMELTRTVPDALDNRSAPVEANPL